MRDPRIRKTPLCWGVNFLVAEGQGFEPWSPRLSVKRFSRPPHSTALPPLRMVAGKVAERRGFEPRIPFWGIHDFQSCSFGQLGHLSASSSLALLARTLVYTTAFRPARIAWERFKPSSQNGVEEGRLPLWKGDILVTTSASERRARCFARTVEPRTPMQPRSAVHAGPRCLRTPSNRPKRSPSPNLNPSLNSRSALWPGQHPCQTRCPHPQEPRLLQPREA